MLGYTADEILGAHVSRFHTEESNDRDWPQYLLDRADAEGWDEDIGWRMRRDGSLFWADVVITALRNEIGGLRGFDKVTRDASSWRQAEETQRRYAEYQASIIQVQADIARSELDTDKLMRLVVDRVQALTNASGALVELLEGDDTLRVAAASGTVSAYRGAQLSLYDSLSGLCIRTERVLGSDDTETDSRVNPGSRQARVRSAVVAPLKDEGRANGVLKVISNQPHAFDEQHRRHPSAAGRFPGRYARSCPGMRGTNPPRKGGTSRRWAVRVCPARGDRMLNPWHRPEWHDPA